MTEQFHFLRQLRVLIWAVPFGVVASLALAASPVPTTMQAVLQRGTGGPEVLKLESVAVPVPMENQVLVHVYAAGVNPIDGKMRSGAFPAPTPGGGAAAQSPAPPRIPGGEFAGVIAAIGRGVTQWKIGDAVYGQGPAMGNGGYAQYALANVDGIAPKPKKLSYAQAAGIPTAALTALPVLRQAGIGPGKTLVIVGAAGGVGSTALQIAKARGARVIAIASSSHNDYLKKLGADEIVNYDKENPATRIKGADAVINLVDGPATSVLSYVKQGGIVVLPTGNIPQEQCSSAGVTCGPVDRRGAPSAAESYAEINRLVDAAQYSVQVQKTFPLAQAGAAQEFIRAGHAEGKIILVTTSNAEKR